MTPALPRSRVVLFVPDLAFRLPGAAIFLVFDVTLAVIAFRASHRVRPLLVPAALVLLAFVVPDRAWAWLLFASSLLSSFAIAIWAWRQKTRRDDESQLAATGPSPWLGQNRSNSLALIVLGGLVMLLATLWDAVQPHPHAWGGLLVGWGSIMLGMGLFRRYTALIHYLGRTRARWLEVFQVATAIVAYALVTASEIATDAGQRLALRVLSLVPFALHFIVVWLPMARAQERSLMPEEPFA